MSSKPDEQPDPWTKETKEKFNLYVHPLRPSLAWRSGRELCEDHTIRRGASTPLALHATWQNTR